MAPLAPWAILRAHSPLATSQAVGSRPPVPPAVALAAGDLPLCGPTVVVVGRSSSNRPPTDIVLTYLAGERQ